MLARANATCSCRRISLPCTHNPGAFGSPSEHASLHSSCAAMGKLATPARTSHVAAEMALLGPQAQSASGGTVHLSCPHGVIIAYKFLWRKETNADHSDLTRSLFLEPAIHWQDDACGQAVHRRGAHPLEAKEVHGENRGCPRAWKKSADMTEDDWVPMSIKQLDNKYYRSVAKPPATTKASSGTDVPPIAWTHVSSRHDAPRVYARVGYVPRPPTSEALSKDQTSAWQIPDGRPCNALQARVDS